MAETIAYIVVSCSSSNEVSCPSGHDFKIKGVFFDHEEALTCIEEWIQNGTRSDSDFCTVVVKELPKNQLGGTV